MRNAARSIHHVARHILLVVLALLYTAGSLQIDSLHRLIHRHSERGNHTPEQEQNACHRVVYHNQLQGACEHPTHLSESKKCPLCQGTPVTAALITTTQSSVHIPACCALIADAESSIAQRDHFLLPPRAPPVMA